MEETQKCTVCGELKPLSEFHKDSSKSNGVSSRCKICSCEYQRRYNRTKRVLDTQSAPKIVNGKIVGGEFDGKRPTELIDTLKKLGYKGELYYTYQIIL